jgi:hypothetical protein
MTKKVDKDDSNKFDKYLKANKELINRKDELIDMKKQLSINISAC